MEIENVIILVVDDQPSNLKVLVSLFKQHDFDVRVAENGELALEMLKKIKPDIILLDVMMPGMNGFEVCNQLKENPATNSIPVIFMTALDRLEDKVAAFTAGGVDYITKPFEQIEVMARINTHIGLRRQTLKLEKALAEVKKLSGLLPICSFCKKIRDDQGYWQQLEKYIDDHSEAQFSHSLCPECMEEHYGELLQEIEKEKSD